MARFSALSAAIVALAFSSQASLVAGQSMDPCVMKAITAAGCSPQDIKCICKGAAEGSLLTDVLTGMVQYCPKTVDVSGSLAILNAGCKSAGVTIPPKNIQEAQQLAGSVFGGGNGGGSSTGGGSTGGGSNTSSAQGSVVTKPPSSPQETQGLGAPVSQPTAIGQSTAVINTDAANGAGGAGGSNTLIMAPSTTPKPNVAGGSNVSSNQASSSGSATPSGGASAGATGGNNQNAGVRSTASMGAAVIGLAAAVMLW